MKCLLRKSESREQDQLEGGPGRSTFNPIEVKLLQLVVFTSGHNLPQVLGMGILDMCVLLDFQLRVV